MLIYIQVVELHRIVLSTTFYFYCKSPGGHKKIAQSYKYFFNSAQIKTLE